MVFHLAYGTILLNRGKNVSFQKSWMGDELATD